MIAVLKRSGLDGRKRPQRLNRARRVDHAFVFSSSCNERPGYFSIASRKICKSLVTVHIACLAYGRRCDFPVERRIHSYAAKSVLIKYASGRIAAASARHFKTRCGVGLRERDHVVNARPAGSVVVADLLWQLGRECRKRRSNDEQG